MCVACRARSSRVLTAHIYSLRAPLLLCHYRLLFVQICSCVLISRWATTAVTTNGTARTSKIGMLLLFNIFESLAFLVHFPQLPSWLFQMLACIVYFISKLLYICIHIIIWNQRGSALLRRSSGMRKFWSISFSSYRYPYLYKFMGHCAQNNISVHYI